MYKTPKNFNWLHPRRCESLAFHSLARELTPAAATTKIIKSGKTTLLLALSSTLDKALKVWFPWMMISYDARIADGIDEIAVRISTNGC